MSFRHRCGAVRCERATSKADCEEAYDNHSYLGGDLELTALSATPRPR